MNVLGYPVSLTLWRYMATRFLLQLIIIGGALASLIYIFEVIELFRRAGGGDVPTMSIIWMGLLKLPETLQVITPFIFLVSALGLFWQLSRSSELVVMRANGISVWQFIAPILTTTFVIGLINFALLQPIAAASISRYQTLETRHLGEQKRIIALNEQGLWIRQAKDNIIWLLYAKNINMQTTRLQSLMVLALDDQGFLKQRYDAPYGYVQDESWILQNGLETKSNGATSEFTTKAITAGIDQEEILSGFTEASTLSSWDMPSQIKTLKNSGFSVRTLLLYYYNLIAAPFLWMSMILIAVTVSLSSQRVSRTALLLGLGVIIGFFYFLFARYFEALSITQRIPELMAVWTPIIIATFVPISVLLQKEDG